MKNVEIVKNYFSALAKGDVQTAFSNYAEDVKWHQPGNNKFSGVKVGVAQISAMIEQMMTDTQGSFQVAPAGNLMENGNFVLAPVRFLGRKENEKQLEMSGIDMFEVVDGKIIAIWLFSDDQKAEDDFWG